MKSSGAVNEESDTESRTDQYFSNEDLYGRRELRTGQLRKLVDLAPSQSRKQPVESNSTGVVTKPKRSPKPTGCEDEQTMPERKHTCPSFDAKGDPIRKILIDDLFLKLKNCHTLKDSTTGGHTDEYRDLLRAAQKLEKYNIATAAKE